VREYLEFSSLDDDDDDDALLEAAATPFFTGILAGARAIGCVVEKDFCMGICVRAGI